VQIVFDAAKNDSSLAKHGVSLELAGSLERDTLLCKPDTRRVYGELRMTG